MKYPEQLDNYDVDIFNENFLELSIGQKQASKDLEDEANRAKAAENLNASKIAEEQSRASVREDTIESNFSAEAQAIRNLIDVAYASANGYTDTKIAQLIGTADETLDTLGEIADALESNETVVDALNSAIGTKANQEELDLHTGNSTIHVTSADKANWNTPTFTQAASRANIESKEALSTLFGKIKKWLADMKTVAFTGKYADLSDTPTSLPANGGNADTVDGHHFHWNGQSGQPNWVWGGNDSANMYVWNPSNFSVNYANSSNYANGAGNANTVDGIHIQVVSALPSDAASHTDTLYIVTG